MYKIKIYCDDNDGCRYWEDGNGAYETYDKALLACYQNALQEAQILMEGADHDYSGRYVDYCFFEVNENFEITDTYKNELLKGVDSFEVATVYYSKAPWDRDNGCDVKIVTGYMIVEFSEED